MFIVVKLEKGTSTIFDWYGLSIKSPDDGVLTFVQVFHLFITEMKKIGNEIYDYDKTLIDVYLGPKKNELTCMSPSANAIEAVSCLGHFLKFNLLTSKECLGQNQSTLTTSDGDSRRDAFYILMNASNKASHMPAKKNVINQKCQLYNDILKWLLDQNVGFMKTNVNTIGTNMLNTLTDVMWCLDGSHGTLRDRGCALPDALEQFDNYFKPDSRKRKKVTTTYLQESQIRNHYTSVMTLCESNFLKREAWSSVKEVIVKLSESLLKYADFLSVQKERVSQAAKQQKATDRDSFEVLSQRHHIIPGPLIRYKDLHSAIMGAKPYEKILVNDYAPGDARRRHEFMRQLVVPVKCIKYTYTGVKEHLTFVWRIDIEDNESTVLSKNIEIATSVKKSLPKYHTRAMRREFLSLFGSKMDNRAGFLREAYKRLTGDCSASANSVTADVDKIIADILDHDDPDLVCDLRVNNSGRPEKYETFLNECQNHISANLETAVDERRHDKVLQEGTSKMNHNATDIVTHFADAFSVSDFYDQVVKKCSADTPIPSKQWLRLQFWPRNTHKNSSARYTGKLKVKFMVQSRQFRKTHEDMHYASALFRYEKEFCIKFRDHCQMVCMDDKHRLKVGEPGYPVAAAERGKPVLVAIGKSFEVADHDFTKFSLIPSVCLKVDIPECIEETFYGGDIFVSLKESVFQSSNPWRHAAELSRVVDFERPILAIYTDGGPDHRLTYGSVQLSLINLFLQGDFDMVTAARTPPHNSWKNPVERIMSVLNLGFQSVGLMRRKICEETEKKLAKTNSISEIRELSLKEPDIEAYVSDSMEPVKVLLYDVVSRLKWKDRALKPHRSSTDEEIEQLASNVNKIDNIDISNTTQKVLKGKKGLCGFLETHCKIRNYLFSVKKCGLSSCKVCKAPRLPQDTFKTLHHLPDPEPDGERYKAFNVVYGTETSERFRPSMKKTGSSEKSGMPFSPTAQYGKNVGMVVICKDCERPRLLYSKNVIKNEQRKQLRESLSELDYTCGSSFDEIDCNEDHVLKKVFIRKNLRCNDLVEYSYYTAGFDPVCLYCGQDNDEASDDYYPVCDDCSNEGHRPLPKRKRMAASKKK